MSVHVMAWVFDHAEQIAAYNGSGRMLVALVLADHVNSDSGLAYPKLKTIAQRAALSERQVSRLLAELVEGGIIAVAFEATNRRPTVYQFKHMAADNLSTLDGDRASSLGVTNETPRGDKWNTISDRHLLNEPLGTVSSLTGVREPISIERPKRSSSSRARRYSSIFETWWARYPKSGSSKADAFDAWKRLSAADKEAAAAGLDKWLVCDRWREGVIVGAAKWLKERRWEVDPPANGAKAPNGRLGESEAISKSLRYFAAAAGAEPASEPTIYESEVLDVRERTT